METTKKMGGKIIMERTRIEAGDKGYFSLIADSEGNRIGLHSDD